jgi:hypothetical protein
MPAPKDQWIIVVAFIVVALNTNLNLPIAITVPLALH